MARAGIALGTNLGDRLAHLRAARDRLVSGSPDPASLLQAPVYQAAPVACPDGSPDFYNTVIELEIDLSPLELLRETQVIECQLGRPVGGPRNAPRVIDVDLLYLGMVRFDSGELLLPHPRLGRRRFVLQPLADIRPLLVLPGHPGTIAARLRELDSSEPPLTLVRAVW